MDKVLVDLRQFDLADRLGADLMSVDKLLNRLEDCLDEIEILKEQLEEEKNRHDINDPDEYDKWLEHHRGD